MKFLCDQCHAKYQIADDKIAGKTLRMKCRRCGHEIEIRGVLESSDQHVAAERGRTTTGSERPRTATGSHDSGATLLPSRPPEPPPRERVPTGAPRPAGGASGRPATGRFPAREPTGASGREPSGTAWKSDALGAGFQRSLQLPKADADRRSSPGMADDWYVAIQDVPVGPVSREEISRRIRAGEVRGASLCWREGFDDWRPLEDVDELASLLRREREPTGAPRLPPPVPGASSRPPTGSFAAASRGPATGSIGVRPPTGRFAAAARPSGSSPSEPLRARVETPPPIESGPRGKVVSIGGRLGGAAAPRIEPPLEPMPDELTTVDDALLSPLSAASLSAPAAPTRGARQLSEPPRAAAVAASIERPASFPPAAPSAAVSLSAPISSPASILVPPQSVPVQVQVQSRGLPAGAWIGIAGASAFGIALAIVVGVRLIGPQPTVVASAPPPPREAPRAAPEPSQPPPSPPAPTAPAPEAVVEIPVEPEAPAAEPAQAPEASATGASGGSRRESGSSSAAGDRGSSAPTSSPGAPAPPGRGKSRSLTDEQRAALAAAAGGSDVATATSGALRVQDRILGGEQRGSGGAPLTEDQISAAVSRNRPSLRACYERSVRGVSQEAMTRFRVSFSISIGGSGSVTRVSVSGAPSSLPGLQDCFERTIRRWRFPASGGASRTEFTALFQPGG